MKKVGIMGGTFDPIHLGHLVIANEVLNMYRLDHIIFVPAGNPPHKSGVQTSSWDRFVMTSLATMSNSKFIVSDFEIKKHGRSYSTETLKEFHKIYSDTEFYFITGTDAVVDLPNWHEPNELLKLCKFIAVSRPGISKESIEIKIQEIQSELNGHIELLQVPMLQISSTDIRERVKKGVSPKYLLPEIVEQYIYKNNLYRWDMNINDIRIKLESFNPKLYEHSIRTMEEAEKLAVHHGINVEKVKIAALLHDCGKKMTKGQDSLTHSKTGRDLARDVFGVNDIEILNAIAYHTTGRENMTMLDKIVFIADKIEPKRNYEGVDELRKAAYTNIDKAIIMSLQSTVEYVKMRNLELDNDSLKTLEFLRRQNARN